ncbi:response regulator [Breoghania sp. L-A4]|uniref:response regulator n=1 Tax=Breoghania sp. L-A4 TaxID=2304600 RepID=UPI000E35A729|nr:response regulator [Breoghania sp. L-A4]AXS41823.1 response regulator [Breoghania sp. L-A4]
MPGSYVMIAVSDSGTGMAPDVMTNVFEPFFTTKRQGTGLGLSMVFGFLKQSGGYIDAYSEPGLGTTFRLYLPRAEENAAVPTAAAEPNKHLATRHETVLVVEDNDAIRRVVVRQLIELGYQVLEAASGAAALDVLTERKVDLLFTDIVMPGRIDGRELANLVTERWPSVKIVLTSGFPQVRNNAEGRAEDIGNLRLLTKPYRRTDLERVIRQALRS